MGKVKDLTFALYEHGFTKSHIDNLLKDEDEVTYSSNLHVKYFINSYPKDYEIVECKNLNNGEIFEIPKREYDVEFHGQIISLKLDVEKAINGFDDPGYLIRKELDNLYFKILLKK